MDDATDWAIRELFELPKDGDLFERLVEWSQDTEATKVRLQNAIHNVLAEALYQNGKMHHGVAVHFLMRLTMLAHEATLPGYGASNRAVMEAVRILGDPGQPNTTEDVGAPRYLSQCQAGPALSSGEQNAKG